MEIFLKYDLRATRFGRPHAEIYEACLEQCAWADAHGFNGVRLHEHHRSDDGYLPAPVVMAAVIAGRTRRLALRCSVIVLPLHDPIELAEQLAVLDNASRGRLEVVVGAGYVSEEFAMFGRRVHDRVQLMERNVTALRRALSGEEFEFEGRPVKVRPRPYQGRTIPVVMGGSSPQAARRAARIADGFEPAPRKFLDDYRAECKRLGKPTGWHPGPGHHLRLLHVAKDPDRAWARMKRHAEHENNSYMAWTTPAGTKVGYESVEDPDELRTRGLYHVVTPEECVQLVRRLGPDAEVQLHPLMGGMDPDLGWESLYLFRSEVMPVLAAEGSIEL